jgi:predicted secreted protein
VVRARLAALLLVPMMVLPAACGGSDDTGGGLPVPGSDSNGAPVTPPSTAATPTPVQATTSTQKYGALTLVINHKPAPPAAAALPLQAYDAFERASHRTQATNVEDPSLATWGAAAALQDIRSILQSQKTQKVRTGGAITVTTKVVRTSAAAAALDTCYDQSKSVLVRANGTTYVGPGAKKDPKLSASVILGNIAGVWKVTEYNLKAEAC